MPAQNQGTGSANVVGNSQNPPGLPNQPSKKPFTPIGAPKEFGPDDPDYTSHVNGQCQRYGRATKELFQATGNQKFLEANRQFRLRHKAVFDFFAQENREFTQTFWQNMEQNLYNLSP